MRGTGERSRGGGVWACAARASLRSRIHTPIISPCTHAPRPRAGGGWGRRRLSTYGERKGRNGERRRKEKRKRNARGGERERSAGDARASRGCAARCSLCRRERREPARACACGDAARKENSERVGMARPLSLALTSSFPAGARAAHVQHTARTPHTPVRAPHPKCSDPRPRGPARRAP